MSYFGNKISKYWQEYLQDVFPFGITDFYKDLVARLSEGDLYYVRSDYRRYCWFSF